MSRFCPDCLPMPHLGGVTLCERHQLVDLALEVVAAMGTQIDELQRALSLLRGAPQIRSVGDAMDEARRRLRV